MSKYTATVIKTGNSYALRVPKALVDDKKLILGQKVQLPDNINITPSQDYDHAKFVKAVKELKKLKPFKDIKDPVAWQREIRKEWDRPISGRE